MRNFFFQFLETKNMIFKCEIFFKFDSIMGKSTLTYRV